MIALIDGDIVAYRNAASAENEDVDIALWRCDDLVRRILHDTGSDSYEVYISGDTNFRYSYDPQYKANRTAARPRWLQPCREFLVTRWGARVADGIEADDSIGISSTYHFLAGTPNVICSLDKDFRQLPGKHYSWEFGGRTAAGRVWTKPAEHTYITPLDGIKNFYKQLLIGDRADNIFGVDGIGKVKAAKLINPLSDEKDMYKTVQQLYNDQERLDKNCNLLWILRQENCHFRSPLAPPPVEEMTQ